MLEDAFYLKVNKQKWWHGNEKVLVAVSAGVDSMALIHLLYHLPKSIRPNLFVAHVNHQLREASMAEETFLIDWCHKHQIPFFSTKWEAGSKLTQNVEQEARVFRYQFFEKVMRDEEISLLLTAHHEDDQIETMLMRLINGNRLKTLTGIQETRPFGNGKLCRPLLTFKKSVIYDYMARQQQTFFEDETNQENSYFRNRLRNNILPSLKQENKQLNEHFLDFNQELSLGLTLIEKTIQPLYENSILFTHDKCEIDLSSWQTYSIEEQHFILTKLVDDLQNRFDLIINKKQQQTIQQLLINQQPNQQLSLKGIWFFEKSYQRAIFSQKDDKKKVEYLTVSLNVNESVFLSETEWFGFFTEQEIEIPPKIKQWSKKELIFIGNENEQLLIRKKLPGDRLIINKDGQSKKISRYFIDEKIPVNKREKSWVVEDSNQEIKWLLPFRGSYLSIRDETAKIHYKLVYCYLEDK